MADRSYCNNTSRCPLCEESIASKQLKRRREFEATLNVAKKQRTEAPIDLLMIQLFIYHVLRQQFEAAARAQQLGTVVKKEPEENWTYDNNGTPGVAAPTETSDTVQIGPNGTTVSRVDFEKLRECSASLATRNLLALIFDRQTLATHSLSGKPSPAFRYEERMLKGQLDTKKVSDIIHCIRNTFNYSEKDIRSTITMKCADVARTFKVKENKNKEN
ncbi:protein insensitive-like [Zeugodacus cucurbitae]|uniref:protein insensitive-like n=1 Tax=Zeugodacus cucurbitae TaxID=28588 RepID=UPI0023D8F798|nr:protein insensitive-like [Zeugodacus cucurbitae]